MILTYLLTDLLTKYLLTPWIRVLNKWVPVNMAWRVLRLRM